MNTVIVPYEIAQLVIAHAAKQADHWMLFVPPMPLAHWPAFADLTEYVVFIDSGQDTLMRTNHEGFVALQTPEHRQHVADQLQVPLRVVQDAFDAPVAGVVLVRKTTTTWKLLVQQINSDHDREFPERDLVVLNDGSAPEQAMVRSTRLLYDAVYATNPDMARDMYVGDVWL